MLIKLDWISFSVPIDLDGVHDDRWIPHAVSNACLNLHEDLGQWLKFDGEWIAGKGRAPYSVSFRNEASGFTIFGNPSVPHALIEISGQGCDTLEDDKTIERVLDAVKDRVTRIDIACDIATDTLPIHFAESRDIGRFKAHSYINSESGSTYYVGARTSDRYCRVYRYNTPHPRHALLRIEYIIKAENAKITARTILEATLESVATSLGESFGWKHPDWRIDSDAVELAVYRPERKSGKTVFWLSDTIAPLLIRLHKEGELDVYSWLHDAVLSKIQKQETTP